MDPNPPRDTGSATDVAVLGPARHECRACGMCCHGHSVGLTGDEPARMREYAAALELPDPIDDEGFLRFDGGRCLFLDTDRLCRIHKRWGMAAKPRVCQVYPRRHISTAGGMRFAIDPTCGTGWQSWRTGPAELPLPIESPTRKPYPPQEVAAEGAVLQATGHPQASVAGLASLVCGGPPVAADLPPGFADRALTRLRAARLAQLLAKPELGSAVGEALAHLPPALDAITDLPPWPGRLTAEQEAFTLDVVRRAIWLRQAPSMLPAVLGHTLVLTVGAVGLAWADPRPEVYGPALAAWTRVSMQRALWLRLFPDPTVLRWLATGR
ncbi:MAG: hypothetical protein ACI8PZ_001212 [Myxococcota bacterium]